MYISCNNSKYPFLEKIKICILHLKYKRLIHGDKEKIGVSFNLSDKTDNSKRN